VATDLFGVPGRLMLKQLIAGEQDATKLAGLARWRLKSKHSQLQQALAGKLSGHHRRMLDRLLRALETREAEIAEDERDIRREIKPFDKAVQAWKQLPGIEDGTAWSLVAEMGPDMAPFDTADQVGILGLRLPGQS